MCEEIPRMIQIWIQGNLEITRYFKFIFCISFYIYMRYIMISLLINNHFEVLYNDKKLGVTMNVLNLHDGTECACCFHALC